ncbi:MAG: trimethylamine methyltransferase family protein [Acidimicrobiales bacterium]|nr:trimethylamine methyltransferase family protein [Acidimicrobiales bacterium]RZV41939.1 MAG: trimethylamine methyltransferase [Acidimicrobiales bacterium]
MARRGRDARRQAREDRRVRWLPELTRGLPFLDVVSDEELDRVHDASCRILEEVGIDFRDDESIAMWKAAGAKVDGYRVYIDRQQLMELISTAPETYTMHSRTAGHDITIGRNKTAFVPAYGAPFVLDMDNKRRNATLEDFDNFAKIAQLEPSMHMAGGVLVEPMDIPVPHRHLEMTKSLLQLSDKPLMGSVTSRERAEQSLHMMGIVHGQEFVRDNCVSTSLANANSPLVWDQTMLDAVKVYGASNQAMLFSPFVLGGASTPASTVGAVAQLSAEALAGVAFMQLVRPGSPSVYGQWTATVAMNSGAPLAGTPEIDHINMLMGQLARRYKLPWRCSGGCSSSKLVDAQAGYESARNMYGVLMAGANFVLSTTGYLESALCQSYAKAMLDGEQMRMMYKLGGGLQMDELDPAMEAVREIEPGDHYLGTDHTLANFESAFFMPELMDGDSYEQWNATGGVDANSRGIAMAQKVLAEYEEPKLPDHTLAELEDYVGRTRAETSEFVS